MKRANSKQQTANSRKPSAFTLVELLLYMGLVAIFLTATIYFAWDIIFGNVKAGVHQEVQENLRFASHKIQTEIRNADSINISESNFGVNLGADPTAKLALTGSSPYYPAEFRVYQGVLQVKRGAGSWISLTSSLVEVADLVFTDLSEFEVLRCQSNLACCFVLKDGGWICEDLSHHGGLDLATDCRGELGGGSLKHHDPCKGALIYENIRFTLTIRHRNPSGRSEWEKEATFETSAQIR